MQHINLGDLKERVDSVNNQLDQISPELHNKTSSLFEPHVTYLRNKLGSVLELIASFEPNRVKRGLVDGLGSVIKSVTGNLDYTDAIHYNKVLKALQDNQNNLVTEFNNHVSVSKNLTTEYSKIIHNIVDNQDRMSNLLDQVSKSVATGEQDIIKFAHIAQILMILSDNVDSISQELTKLQNNLAFIRTSTMHHSVLNLHALRSIVIKLSTLYDRDRIIDLDIREYFDIIRLGSYYVGNEIVIVYKFPIIISPIYDIYKLAIIPNKNHEILTPPTPFLALYEKEFRYIEAECPRTSKWYLCEERRSLQSRTSEDCIQQLITMQQRNTICHPISVVLDKPAYEELDEKHYTISFPVPTKVHLSCGQHLYETLQGSYLAIIPQQCRLETSHFTISNTNDRLRGQALKILDLPNNNAYISSPSIPTLKLNSVNLDNLHRINTKISQQLPIKLNEDMDHSSLYHTTIPMYAAIITLCALAAGLHYRNRHMKPATILLQKSDEEDTPEPQIIYALPNPARTDSNHLPAQFTTKVFNTRCSTGGGVTQS